MYKLELLPAMVRGGLHCYSCRETAKYIVDWTIQYKDGDVNLRTPMCNKCAAIFNELLPAMVRLTK